MAGTVAPSARRIVIALLLVCGTSVGVVRAQDTATGTTSDDGGERPFRGLFRTPSNSSRVGQSLDLLVTVRGAYDDDVVGGLTNTNELQRSTVSGMYSAASATLSYSRRGRKLSAGLMGDASATYSPDSLVSLFKSYSGSGNIGTSFGAWRLSTAASAATAPFYQLNMVLPPEVADAVAAGAVSSVDYGLEERRINAMNASANLSRSLSRRTGLSFEYSTMRNELGTTGVQLEQQARGSVSRMLAKGLSLRTGYGYRMNRPLDTARPFRSHDIDLGLSFDRSLSFSRKTRVSFASGSSIYAGMPIQSPSQVQSDDVSASQRTRYYFAVTGNADLIHEFGRTWGATLSYRRGLDYTPGFSAPILSNIVSTALGGYLMSRVHLSLAGFYSIGAVGFDTGGGSNSYDSTTAMATVTTPITRRLSVFTQYFYYLYSFDNAADVPLGLPSTSHRQGVRAGVSLSVPILSPRRGISR